jgi:hypothetical protein
MKSLPFLSVTTMAVCATLTAGMTGARAGDAVKTDAYAQRLFAGKVGNPKSHACFARVYDAAHLARHPKQTVREMTLLVTAEKVPEDEKLNYSFSLSLNLRDRPEKFVSSGDCGHPVASAVSADKLHLGCGVDCDGGGISVELADHDKAIMVRLDRVRIWSNNNPEDNSRSLTSDTDDGAFRLVRTSLDDCRPLMADDKERSAMLRN